MYKARFDEALIIITAIALSSCHTTRYIPMPSSHTRDSTHLSVYTRADSIREYVSDSMSIRFGKVSSAGGNGIPDTVYIDRWHTAYRDRWHTLNHTDTITVTRHDSIPYPVEVPVEVPAPIPRLYRSCTVGFFLILIAISAFIALRLYLRR